MMGRTKRYFFFARVYLILQMGDCSSILRDLFVISQVCFFFMGS